MIIKCEICGTNMVIDNYGNGQCKNCKWHISEQSLKNPNEVIYPNITSFNHAKELYALNKKIKPSFSDLIKMIENHGEIEFYYKKHHYGITKFDGIEIYEWDKEDGYQSYNNINEFITNAKINGEKLKDIWDNVVRVNYI